MVQLISLVLYHRVKGGHGLGLGVSYQEGTANKLTLPWDTSYHAPQGPCVDHVKDHKLDLLLSQAIAPQVHELLRVTMENDPTWHYHTWLQSGPSHFRQLWQIGMTTTVEPQIQNISMQWADWNSFLPENVETCFFKFPGIDDIFTRKLHVPLSRGYHISLPVAW